MENNKLIAEFMGVNPTILGDEITYEMYGVIDCIEDGVDKQHFFLEEQLLFHTSWDWLMPVVEKIESHGIDFFIVGNRVKIAHNTDHSTNIILDSVYVGGKMTATYKAVVEFIKLINTQPPL